MSHPLGTNGEVREIVVSDAIELFVRLLEFYEPDEAEKWMRSPHPQLENKTALSLIANGQSDAVNQVILRLETDAYI